MQTNAHFNEASGDQSSSSSQQQQEPSQSSFSSNLNVSELSFDTKVIITVILFIAFYPAGLITMFIWNIGPMWLRIVLILPLAFLTLGFFGFFFFNFLNFLSHIF